MSKADRRTRSGAKGALLASSPKPVTDAGVALVLQGGGALGAYQGGVYQQLASAGYDPNWYAGVSIGAINAAILAGNPAETRLERLREFWQLITSSIDWPVYF